MMANDARRKLLVLKERRLEALFGEVYFKIKEDINDIEFYKKIFKLLVLQALCLVRYWHIKTAAGLRLATFHCLKCNLQE